MIQERRRREFERLLGAELSRCAPAVAAERARLEGVAREVGLPDQVWRPVAERLLGFQVATDRIAVDQQRVATAIDATVALLTVLASLAGGLSMTYLDKRPGPSVAEALVALLGAVLVIMPWRSRAHRLWVRSRYLAEHARIALAVATMGIDVRSALHGAVHALPADADPSLWVRRLLDDVLAPVAGRRAVAAEHAAAASAYIDRSWLRQQAEWHRENGARKEGLARVLERTGFWVFLATMLVALVGAVDEWNDFVLAAWMDDGLDLLALVLPVVATGGFLLSTQREYGRVAARSKRMARVFAALGDDLRAAADPAARLAVVERAARAACVENYEWSVLLGTAPQG